MGRDPIINIVLIFLGVLLLITFIITFYLLESRIKRRRVKRWLASQPPEVIISGRERAAEKARALLQEQTGYYAFMAEFEQSQDPEIQKLVAIVAEFLQEGSDEYDFQNWFKDSMKEKIFELDRTKMGNKGSRPS